MSFNAHHQYPFLAILALIVFLAPSFLAGALPANSSMRWVGTWSTAPQLVEPGNMPPSPGLTDNSLRQVVRVSLGGETLRVKFSNEFSASPVTMHSVRIALSTGGRTADPATSTLLTFGGSAEVTMTAGSAVISDPAVFHLEPRMDVAITISFGQTSASVTGHPGSRTTSYLLAGDSNAGTDFTPAVTTDHWYVISGIDVLAPAAAGAVAIIGNSITDGRGSTTNLQNRWPDILSERLLNDPATRLVGVLNQGIGGNCVLKNCLGPSAVSRFQRDILNQAGIRWAIIYEGVNDIGGVGSPSGQLSVARDLIAAYSWMIDSCHAHSIAAYGATIMPFKGNSYYNTYSERCRDSVNQWIRTSGRFDAVIDFDLVMRSTIDTLALPSSYQNDGLHPDSAGHRTMGNAVDLTLFTDTASHTEVLHEPGSPNGFTLEQNFPNPFNPSTTIAFTLSRRSFVTLSVYDALARHISTIVSEELPSGSYARRWDPLRIPSGVYFYRLTAGIFSETKKLLLLR